jgi:hypothetical protein
MKKLLLALLMFHLTAGAQTFTTPVDHGVLTSDLNANGHAVNNASNLIQDYAGEATYGVDSRIAGLTASSSTQNIYSAVNDTTHVYTRNAAAWFADVDLTCLSALTSDGWWVTAIAPKYGVTAYHITTSGGGPLATGATVYFVTNANATVTATISAITRIGSTDLAIVTFSADLPSTITPAMVMPATLPIDFSFVGCPVLYTDQYRKVYVAEVTSTSSEATSGWGLQSAAAANRTAWTKSGPAAVGDSSNPYGLIIAGRFVLSGAFYNAGGHGPDVGANATAVSAVFSGGYALTVATMPSYPIPSNLLTTANIGTTSGLLVALDGSNKIPSALLPVGGDTINGVDITPANIHASGNIIADGTMTADGDLITIGDGTGDIDTQGMNVHNGLNLYNTPLQQFDGSSTLVFESDSNGNVTAATLTLGGHVIAASHNITLDTDGTGTRTLNVGAGGTLASGAFAAAFNPAAPGAIGGTTPSTIASTGVSVTKATGTNTGYTSTNTGTGASDNPAFYLANGSYAASFFLTNAAGTLSNTAGWYTSAPNGFIWANSSGTEVLGVTQGGIVSAYIINASNVNASGTLTAGGNGQFGTNTSSATSTPLNVSFGGTYGTNTPGSPGNLKWDLYRDASGSRYGIGMSSDLMEFQAGAAGDAGAFSWYSNGVQKMHLDSSGNLVVVGTVSGSGNPALRVTGTESFPGESSPGTVGKIACNTVVVDNKSWWDSTNKRYTPQLAGRYTAKAYFAATAVGDAATLWDLEIAQNSVTAYTAAPLWLNRLPSSISYGPNITVVAEFIMNGSTDYIELFGGQGDGTAIVGFEELDITYVGPN